MVSVDEAVVRRQRPLDDDPWAAEAAASVGLAALGWARSHDHTDVSSDEDAAIVLQDLWYRSCVPFGKPDAMDWLLLTHAFAASGGHIAATLALYGALRDELGHPGDRPACDATGLTLVRTASGSALGIVAARAAAARGELVFAPPEQRQLHASVLSFWTDMPAQDRTLLLVELAHRTRSLEQLRLFADGDLLNNAAVASALLTCASSPPVTWSYGTLALASLVAAWHEATFVLQEYNHALMTLPHVSGYLRDKLNQYAAAVGVTAPTKGTIAEMGEHLRRLRVQMERTHERCLQFDGGNWERREFIIPKTTIDAATSVPPDLRALLAGEFGIDADAEDQALFELAVDACGKSGIDPTDVVKVTAQWVADSDRLLTDYSIFTFPIGVKLDRPWELNYEDVACHVAFRDGFVPTRDGVPLDVRGIANVVGQRMRFNVVKKAQNYTNVKRFPPQSFNLPDIAVAEDANHQGHNVSGIRQTCRIPTLVRYRGFAWKGLADIRLNRTVYGHDREFRPSDVPAASSYAVWLGWIVDAAYARDMTFDEALGRMIELTAA